MQVYTSVDEADIGRVRVGQHAVFTVPAFPDELFAASVTQIRNDPQIQQNVVTYNVILDVSNDELKLRPGMTTNVQIRLSEVQDALMVPQQAFQFTPRAARKKISDLQAPGSGQRRLWKLEANNVPKPLIVEIGIVGGDRVQIISDELKPDDRVVVEEIIKKTDGGTKSSMPQLRF